MSYRASHATGGIIVASLCAGPVFAGMALAMQLFDGNDTISPIRPGLFWLIPVSVFFGFILAIIPNIFGATLLMAIGKRNEGVRLPVVWGLVGGLIAGGIAFGCDADAGGIAAFAATGTICALICRRGAIWR